MWRQTMALMQLVRVTAHLVGGLLTVVVLFPRSTPRARSARMRHWAQSLLAILNIEQSLTGVMPAEFGVPALLVANHISWLDVVALMSVGATTFVAKSEVRRWPVIGWMAQHTGTTFIQRGRRHDIARVNQALADNLASGACAAIFPEGTTTDGTGLLPFHSGLFEAARGAGAWVWPVAIRYHHADGTITHAADFLGDASLLASLWRIALAPSLRIGLAYAAPLVMRGKHRRELATQARERIAALLQIPVTSHQSRPRIEAVEHAYHGGSELSSQQKIA